MKFYIPHYYGSLLAPKLAQKFNVPEDRIIVACGAEDLLTMAFDMLNPAKDSALLHKLHFDFYHIYLKGRGVPYHEFRIIEGKNAFSFDIHDCVLKIKKFKPKLILITSPNNPTGNSISYKDAVRILNAAPKTSIVALDEAYYGFDPKYEEKKFLALVKRYPNLMLIRTFSKLYALAGMRIGYALCGKDIVPMLKYIRPRLGGSRVLEEVAAAALESPAYYRKLSKEIARERKLTLNAVNKLSHFKAFDAKGNALTIKIDPVITPYLLKEMKEARALVCKLYGPHLLRVSVSNHEYMEAFRKMMKRVDKAILLLRAG
jgi:histidinol-phosphate aminotransferase